jgi:hypothetical protein
MERSEEKILPKQEILTTLLSTLQIGTLYLNSLFHYLYLSYKINLSSNENGT